MIDPFGKGTRIAGHGPTSTDVLDVSNGILTTASGGWFSRAKVGPHGEDPEWDTPVSAKWNGPISDLVVTIDEAWVAAPFAPGRAPLRPTIFRVVSPIKEPIGESLEIPEPARLDFGYGKLWAAQSMGHDWLTRIDPETLEQTTVPEPVGDRWSIDADLDVSVGAGAVWIYLYGSLARVDPATAKVSGEWPMAGTQGVVEPTEDMGVFVMTHRSQTLSRLHRVDPNSGEVLGEPLDFAGPGPFALESGFRSLWVADQSKDKVYRIEVGEKASPEPEVVYPDEEVEVSPEPELDEGNDKKSEKEKAIEALVEKISNRLANQTAVKELIRLMKQDELSLEEEAHLQALMKNLLGESRDRADLITEAIERALEEAQNKTEAP